MQSLTYLFLILCCTQSACHGCEWIRHQFGTLSGLYLTQLDEMGGNITQQEVPVVFPEFLYERTNDTQYVDQVRFLNETIHEITELFDENMDAVTWDKKKLGDFLILLHRQFTNLKSCVLPARRPDKTLKHYFKELKKVLRKMNYSAQAWELIRKETKYHLQKLDLLVANMH
ncbi:hypothetical protein DPEC_G00275700 [Dallia pectoralis]|uniref:Uncharacterized protein n=1 Tax=Dallia pectoralis TaxID=75939 RepID=A0ACC2FLQ3_DALPE|nr:hypothetical protein DPEC_G00275700 [Dallia pectoralis]